MSLLLSACGPHPALVRAVEKRNPEIVFSVPTQDAVVAMTIDDGPHEALTPAILDLLAEHDAKATFFLMGRNVAGNEGLVRRMVAEGHEIGNHMMGAAPAILLPLDRFEASLLETQALLSGYGPVRWFRPASGFIDRPMLEIAARHGYRVALGSVYPNDAQNPFPAYLAGYILRNVRPGAVLILHDGSWLRWRTVHTLRRVLPELRRRGYRVVTLSELEGMRQDQP